MALRVLLTNVVLAGVVITSASAEPKMRKERESITADSCAAYICIEANTGVVVSEGNADDLRPAASMVKMMLFLMVSEGLQSGAWTLEQPITVSKLAEGMGGSQAYLKAGEVFTLGQLMEIVAVGSANDAAVAVAEGLWRDRETYLKAVNARAQELGMIDSVFHSVNGLPPSKGEALDQTTARDMAILAQWCVRHPRILDWTSETEIQFRPNEMTKKNTNDLLRQFPGCDGLKTGYTRAAGWNVAATAVRDEVRIIVVVMGGATSKGRFQKAQELLNEGFSQIRRVHIVAKGQSLAEHVQVQNCETESIQPTAADDLVVVVRVNEVDQIKVIRDIPAVVRAPISSGIPLGEIRAELPGKVLARIAVMLPHDLTEASWQWKLKHSVVKGIQSITGSG